MSQDGADLNIPAEAAMKAVIGGEKPTPMTDAEFEAMIRNASDASGYSGAANVFARQVLEFLEAHPEYLDRGSMDDVEYPNGFDQPAVMKQKGLYTLMKEAGVQIEDGLSGFMVGWGVNAARHILKQKPVANPAILEL